MGSSLIFMLGCWLGCIVGVFLTGLTAASRANSDEIAMGSTQDIARRNPLLSAAQSYVEEAQGRTVPSTMSPPLN